MSLIPRGLRAHARTPGRKTQGLLRDDDVFIAPTLGPTRLSLGHSELPALLTEDTSRAQSLRVHKVPQKSRPTSNSRTPQNKYVKIDSLRMLLCPTAGFTTGGKN